ncbi:MAG: MBOAT family protein [Dokdonella sp.]|uniref:MBOAT family O-acyltransferase n=1 Tax=Dokdonella sp. TaxID=2291710 RepID=UPI0025C2F5A5|nr:MBOAT family O-acyltransferase [Dokdonella sp.]MBX3701004.1 MBOAT family protein [Dokdonella sp.]
MLFNSFHFVAFFLVVLALNQTLRAWPFAQKLMLLAASYYFYGQWQWHYLLLVWFSTLVDYAIGLRLPHTPRPRRLVVLSVIVNLGFLAVFKYANWLIATVNDGAQALGSVWHLTPIDLLLPVGISFYTFQSLSYTIDVYRRELPPRRNLLDYALAVAFFPQIEAGPIVRAREFLAELDGEQRVGLADIRRALVLIALGYVKKIVLADNLALLVDPVFDTPLAHGFWDCLLAVYAFAFQIYCDFSGYTDIAIGCALLLGIRFPPNFDYPYAARSLQEFWHRWHMTLSRWLRDYLYIPLGGNRKGHGRTYANLMLTMLLGGLWHGASWNFVIWGGLHGAYLAGERAWPANLAIPLPRAMAVALRVLITFHLTCLAWVFFRARDLDLAIDMLGRLAQPQWRAFALDAQGTTAALLVGLFAAQQLGAHLRYKERIAAHDGLLVIMLGLVMAALILFAPSHSAPFIYFQF